MPRPAHIAGALVAVALAAGCASLPDRPPHEPGRFREADLVELDWREYPILDVTFEELGDG